jgi:putative spermidine/putrescine transport system substrate-binding protein
MRTKILTLALAFCGWMSQVAAQEVTLRVASYDGAFTEIHRRCVADLLAAKSNIQTRWIDANPMDHLSKILAAKDISEPPYDIFYLDEGPFAQGVEAGLFLRLDPAIVTNLDKIYSVARRSDDHGVTTNVGTIGIAFNEKILKEKAIPEPRAWSDLWNQQLAGHVAIPDVTTSGGMNTVNVAAWLTGGDERNVRDAFKKLAEIK